MKKTLFPALACFAFIQNNAQVGVNTNLSRSTFDIVAKSPTGTSSSVDGLLLPRVSRQRAQSMTSVPVSTLIYVNNITTGTQTGTTINVDTEGYYYFDGSVWIKLITNTNTTFSTNIYNSDGKLSGQRTVTQGTNTLTFVTNAVNGFSVDDTTFSVDSKNDRVGLGTSTPLNKLHVNGNVQITNELNVGGNANTAGNPGTFGQVLTSNGSGTAPSWQTINSISGTIYNTYYVQGTTALTIQQGSTADVPGVSIVLTVPAGRTQTFLFSILGYAIRSVAAQNGASQGVFSLVRDGVKVSSAYVSSGDGGGLVNLPSPVNFLKAVTLTSGTYTFKVRYTSWFGDQIVNHLPSNYGGYNGDTEAMLTKMQVLVYNN